MTPVAWGVRRASDGAIVSAFVNKENAVFGAAEIGGVDFDDGYQAVPLYAAPADRAMTEALAKCVEALAPFANFIEKFDAMPLRQFSDVFYGIHVGTKWEAELRLSDLHAARLALAAAARAKGE